MNYLSLFYFFVSSSVFAAITFDDTNRLVFKESKDGRHSCPDGFLKVEDQFLKEYYKRDVQSREQMRTARHKQFTYHRFLRSQYGEWPQDPGFQQAQFESEYASLQPGLLQQPLRIPLVDTAARGLVDAGKKLYDEYLGPKDHLIFLGRSPGLFRFILEYMEEKSSSPKALSMTSISFSAHPGIVTSTRTSTSGADKGGCLDLTEDRMEWFFRYLDSLGLNELAVEEGTKVWIVDMISRGSALNSFLQLFQSYCESRGRTDLFDHLQFFSLINKKLLNVAEDKSDFSLLANKPKWSYAAGRLDFEPTDKMKELGYTSFHIDAVLLPVEPGVLFLQDDDSRKSLSSYQSTSLPCCQWKGDFPTPAELNGPEWPVAKSVLELTCDAAIERRGTRDNIY